MKSYEGFKALTNKPGRCKYYTVLSWSYGLSIASAKMSDLLLLYCWQSRVLSLVFKLLSNCHFSFPREALRCTDRYVAESFLSRSRLSSAYVWRSEEASLSVLWEAAVFLLYYWVGGQVESTPLM